MKRLYLLLLSGLLLASCVKEELPQPSEGEEPLSAARHPLRWRERPVQTVAGAGGARRQTRPNGTAENRVGTDPPVRMLFSDRFGPGSPAGGARPDYVL